jgi:alkanesulfonate monooxygenase SsuD/methylene tetrahydromethanopterin reductase-like flavin-dependent oxidoreductase (luciferase family)
LREIILPALEQGATKAGRSRSEISLSVTAFAVTTPEENALVRAQIAFYASTPSYRAVMSHHGWEETAIKLSALARRGQWSDMLSLISDEMLATFAVIAQPEALSEALCKKYQGLADHLTLYIPFIPGEMDQFWRQLITHVG